MSSSKLSTSRARRLHREMGNRVQFPLPGNGGAWEGLKKSMALPFRPVGARWPGGNGYGTRREHQGCASEGPGGVGGKVASQLKARSVGRGIGSRGCIHSPPPVESYLVNIYTEQSAWVLLGARGCAW